VTKPFKVAYKYPTSAEKRKTDILETRPSLFIYLFNSFSQSHV